MNFQELGITSVIPLAKLEGGMNGVRLIVEATKGKGFTEILSILPPNYDLSQAVHLEKYKLESAIAKHGYTLVEEPLITDFVQYEQYLTKVNQPLDK